MLHRRERPAQPFRRGLATAAALAIGFVFASVPAGRVARAQSAPSCPAASSRVTGVDSSRVQITFTDSCGDTIPLMVDVASADAQQEEGLMNVTDLPANEGELFVFDNLAGGSEVDAGFWMEDTPINLSVAFIGSDMDVQDILDMQAETTNVHVPSHPYLYAVEANQGWFAEHDIQAGSMVNLAPALALLGQSGG